MKAMILAAGLGTRVRPLSTLKPKPLFPILNRPIIDILIRQLKKAGCEAIIINTHHLAERITDYLSGQDYGIPVTIRFEPAILGTAGGIKNVEDFWDDRPFIVINTDVLTDINLAEFYRFHISHDNAATLILHDFPKFNNVQVNRADYVIGFDQLGTDRKLPTTCRRLAFTGIQVIDPGVLEFIPKGEFASSIDVYQAMLKSGFKVKGYITSNHYWQDIGSFEGYRQGVRDCLEGRCQIPDISLQKGRTYCGSNLVIGENSRFDGWNSIGDSVSIGNNCLISRSVIWDNVTIGDGVTITDSVVGDGAVVSKSISGEMVV
ncbi:MAG: NDP-sugar synthase [Deltaproteobacteria bacterium]|nr:NDP-sugar synthase [Deltaproteobacteria bacterium]